MHSPTLCVISLCRTNIILFCTLSGLSSPLSVQHVLFLCPLCLFLCQPANVCASLPSAFLVYPFSVQLHVCIQHSFTSTFHLPVLSCHFHSLWPFSAGHSYLSYLVLPSTTCKHTLQRKCVSSVICPKSVISKLNHERSVPNVPVHMGMRMALHLPICLRFLPESKYILLPNKGSKQSSGESRHLLARFILCFHFSAIFVRCSKLV